MLFALLPQLKTYVVAALLIVAGVVVLACLMGWARGAARAPSSSRCTANDADESIFVYVVPGRGGGEQLASVFHNARCPTRVYAALHHDARAEYLALTIAANHVPEKNRVRWIADGDAALGSVLRAVRRNERYMLLLQPHVHLLPGWDDMALDQFRAAEKSGGAASAALSTVVDYTLPFTNVPIYPPLHPAPCVNADGVVSYNTIRATDAVSAPRRAVMINAAFVFSRATTLLHAIRHLRHSELTSAALSEALASWAVWSSGVHLAVHHESADAARAFADDLRAVAPRLNLPDCEAPEKKEVP